MRTLLALTLALFLCGCAATKRSGSSPLLSAEWEPASGQTCQLLSGPSVLPAAHQLLDPAAVGAALATGPSDLAQRYAVIEVAFDSAGLRERARVIDASVPAPAAEELLGSVVSTAPDGVGAGRPWGVLIKATHAGGLEAVFEVGRMEYCACSLVNRREFSRALGHAAQRVRLPHLAGRSLTRIIDVKSDSTGAIVEKRLHQSTGYLDVDRMAVELADRMVVAPPLLNRRPVDMWSRIPVTLSFPARNEADS